MSFKCNYNIHLFEANFPVLFYIGYFQGLSSAYRRKPRGKFILRKNKDMTISQKKHCFRNLGLQKRPRRLSDEHLLARHVEKHFPDFLPTNEKGKRLERRCIVCYVGGKVKRTSYCCSDCDIGLSAASCFKLYHQPQTIYYVKRNTGNVSYVYMYITDFCTFNWSFLITLTFWFC